MPNPRSVTLAAALLGLLAQSAPAAPPPQLDWTPLTPVTSPSRRAALAIAYDPVAGQVVIFGGYDANGYLNDTWTFDGRTWTQQAPPSSPPARAAASMAWDAASQRIVLFGGFSGSQYLGDTWLWDGASATWTQAAPATSPAPVTGPMLFTDPKNGHADVYGGYDGHLYQLTTFQWAGSDWQQLFPASSPYARAGAAVAYDEKHGQVVLFGGLASVNPWNTWLWDGTNWTLQSPSVQPANRYDSAAAFDPHLGAVVMFGGGSGGLDLDDTWEWTGSDWVELFPMNSPPKRESFGMAYSPELHRVIVVGGEDHGTLYKDTWSLLDPGSFVDVGPGIGGPSGAPALVGMGDLTPGSLSGFTLSISGTTPGNPMVLFLGLGVGALPFKGGSFYPVPLLGQFALVANGSGGLQLHASLPAAVPGGSSFVLQCWMPDATAPALASGTNGLQANVP